MRVNDEDGEEEHLWQMAEAEKFNKFELNIDWGQKFKVCIFR